MKVKIGPYPKWIACQIYDRWMNRRYGDWPDEPTKLDNFVESIDKAIQSIYNVFNNHLRGEQKIQVRIDNYDTWSFDHTLAHIILPGLIQLRDTKHGAPSVDDEDVPQELRRTEKADLYDVDDNWHNRWDYVLNEMIFAFDSVVNSDWEDKLMGPAEEVSDAPIGFRFPQMDKNAMEARYERMNNGFRLFGKYYRGLWT